MIMLSFLIQILRLTSSSKHIFVFFPTFWLFFLRFPYQFLLISHSFYAGVLQHVSLALFFIYIYSLYNLIQFQVFRYHLYAEDFQICISRPNLTHITTAYLPSLLCWLMDVSYSTCLKLNLYFFCLISILRAAFSILFDNMFQVT